MTWDKVRAKIGQVAPPLGRIVAGSPGESVGRLVGNVLGVSADPESILLALDDPEKIAELRRFERDMLELRLADLQDARVRHRGHWMPSLLTLLWVAILVGVLVALFILEAPGGNRDLIFTVIGIIIARATQGSDYWLGSSRGSAEKQTEIMRRDGGGNV